MAAPSKWYRVRVAWRWTDPRTGESKEFYEVGRVYPASEIPEPEKHLKGVDDKGPLIEEAEPPATATDSTKEK